MHKDGYVLLGTDSPNKQFYQAFRLSQPVRAQQIAGEIWIRCYTAAQCDLAPYTASPVLYYTSVCFNLIQNKNCAKMIRCICHILIKN